MLPRIGKLISAHRQAYPTSHEPSRPPSSRGVLQAHGRSWFPLCKSHPLTFGIVTIYKERMSSLVKFLEEGVQFPKDLLESRGSRLAFCRLWRRPGWEKLSSNVWRQAFSPQSCQGVWSCFPTSLFFSPTSLKQEVWILPVFLLSFQIIRAERHADIDQWWMTLTMPWIKIKNNHLKKIVLARQTTLTFDGKNRSSACPAYDYSYGKWSFFIYASTRCWYGIFRATPEKLFHRQERKITSEALAGPR